MNPPNEDAVISDTVVSDTVINDTVISGTDLLKSSPTKNLQTHPAEELIAPVDVVILKDDPSQCSAEGNPVDESLQSNELEQDQMKRSLELIGMKEIIKQMESKQEKLETEIAKLTAQGESYQTEIRSLTEKLNKAMAAVSSEKLKRYKDLPIMKMSSKCWSRNAWFKIYEEKMATTDKRTLKACLMYYLSDDFQTKSFLEHFSHRNYDDLKFMFLKSTEF